MKKTITTILLTILPVLATMAAGDGVITTRNVSLQADDSRFAVSMDMVLDQLHLSSNSQVLVTPYLQGEGGNTLLLPTVLVNGRNMQYVYQRQGLSRKVRENYNNIYKVCARKNSTQQTVDYAAAVAVQPWMKESRITLHLATDTCGCGIVRGKGVSPELAAWEDTPHTLPHLHLAYIVPPVTEQPVVIHEGKARVQFEVDKTELHTQPYVCKSGQRIDNRQQLQVICDSIDYATSDPNVELAAINVCGYASPESPYLHNEYLATNRSRALAEYIGSRYNLPQERSTYDAVPENWAEFRQQVVAATDITDQQRQNLLELIDKQTYGPTDFDAKETMLKTDPRFAQLYKTKILPVWFPQLRCTKFAISTRLKPTSDEKLAEIIRKTPELLSLNQMFRVARLYGEGTKEFNEVIAIALSKYKDNEVANLNAAVAAITAEDYDRAAQLLEKAGNSPEAENARGVLAAHGGDLEAARQHFRSAGNLSEALRNLELLR